ncbi:serine/threonine-protein phosphatase [Streptomyces sp. MT29]|nr:serine/threonine-protein phosphatase [Streptomyces sp. MT29]
MAFPPPRPAVMLGALRGMAVAGIEPGALMGHLDHLLETSVRSALGSALCCRFDPATGLLSWAQAGHPAPLLFRDGTGRRLPPPEGALLGAASRIAYEQDEVRLLPGDVLVLHTDGLTLAATGVRARSNCSPSPPGSPRPVTHRSACGAWSKEFGGAERLDDACVLVARIGA